MEDPRGAGMSRRMTPTPPLRPAILPPTATATTASVQAEPGRILADTHAMIRLMIDAWSPPWADRAAGGCNNEVAPTCGAFTAECQR
eukprot:2435647-Pyramimonas_sp.AAC.1